MPDKITGPDVASIAARGLANPKSLTAAEIMSLAGSALAQVESEPVTDEHREALTAERLALITKARKRRDMPGFAQNVEAIDARIAEIDAELSEEA